MLFGSIASTVTGVSNCPEVLDTVWPFARPARNNAAIGAATPANETAETPFSSISVRFLNFWASFRRGRRLNRGVRRAQLANRDKFVTYAKAEMQKARPAADRAFP